MHCEDVVARRFAAELRQYESRSTFRNLALSTGANEFHLNLITHPKPKKASDHYTRLEMQWEAMCQAVLTIDAKAWAGMPEGFGTDEVTGEGTVPEVQKGKAPEPFSSEALNWRALEDLNLWPSDS